MWCFKCAQFGKLLDIGQMLIINGWCPLFTGLHRYRHFLQFCTNCTNLPLFKGSPVAQMSRCPSFDRGARPLNNRMEPKKKNQNGQMCWITIWFAHRLSSLLKNGASKQHVLCYRINLHPIWPKQYSPNGTILNFATLRTPESCLSYLCTILMGHSDIIIVIDQSKNLTKTRQNLLTSLELRDLHFKGRSFPP